MKAVDDSIPEEARKHWAAANVLLGNDQLEKALREYDQALRISPHYGDARFNRALTNERLGRDNKALDDLLVLIVDEPPRPDVWTFVGRIIAKRDGPQLARPFFERAVAIDDKYELAQKALQENGHLVLHRTDDTDLGESKVKKDESQPESERTESEEGQLKHSQPVESRKRLDSVIGLAQVKRLSFENIILPMQRPELYRKYGKKHSPHVLLYGPPGCGKTLFVAAISGELGARIILARLHELVDMYTGNTEKNIHQLFEQARFDSRRASKPVVIFIDELDALGVKRGDDMDSSANRKGLDQLLVELDGIESANDGLIVIGATNRPWDIDPALKRSGRFDDLIYIPPPSEEERKQLVDFYTKDRPHESLSLDELAKRTVGYSCADIRKLVDMTTMLPLLREYQTSQNNKLTTRDFLEVLGQPGFSGGSLDEWWFMMSKEILRDPLDKMRYKPMVDDARKFIRRKARGHIRNWKRRNATRSSHNLNYA
jgi:SpoVK/Ycf46/Vps4 family AAA+-type ATPase